MADNEHEFDEIVDKTMQYVNKGSLPPELGSLHLSFQQQSKAFLPPAADATRPAADSYQEPIAGRSNTPNLPPVTPPNDFNRTLTTIASAPLFMARPSSKQGLKTPETFGEQPVGFTPPGSFKADQEDLAPDADPDRSRRGSSVSSIAASWQSDNLKDDQREKFLQEEQDRRLKRLQQKQRRLQRGSTNSPAAAAAADHDASSDEEMKAEFLLEETRRLQKRKMAKLEAMDKREIIQRNRIQEAEARSANTIDQYYDNKMKPWLMDAARKHRELSDAEFEERMEVGVEELAQREVMADLWGIDLKITDLWRSETIERSSVERIEDEQRIEEKRIEEHERGVISQVEKYRIELKRAEEDHRTQVHTEEQSEFDAVLLHCNQIMGAIRERIEQELKSCQQEEELQRAGITRNEDIEWVGGCGEGSIRAMIESYEYLEVQRLLLQAMESAVRAQIEEVERSTRSINAWYLEMEQWTVEEQEQRKKVVKLQDVGRVEVQESMSRDEIIVHETTDRKSLTAVHLKAYQQEMDRTVDAETNPRKNIQREEASQRETLSVNLSELVDRIEYVDEEQQMRLGIYDAEGIEGTVVEEGLIRRHLELLSDLDAAIIIVNLYESQSRHELVEGLFSEHSNLISEGYMFYSTCEVQHEEQQARPTIQSEEAEAREHLENDEEQSLTAIRDGADRREALNDEDEKRGGGGEGDDGAERRGDDEDNMEMYSEEVAATKVQALYRGHNARKRAATQKAAAELKEAIDADEENKALQEDAIVATVEVQSGNAALGSAAAPVVVGGGIKGVEAHTQTTPPAQRTPPLVLTPGAGKLVSNGLSVEGPNSQFNIPSDNSYTKLGMIVEESITLPGSQGSSFPPGLTIFTTCLQSNRAEFDDCKRLRHCFDTLNIGYGEIDIASNQAWNRSKLSKKSNQTKLPQIFIGDAYVGTYETISNWNDNGQLGPELKSRGYGKPQTITAPLHPNGEGDDDVVMMPLEVTQQQSVAKVAKRPDDWWIKKRENSVEEQKYNKHGDVQERKEELDQQQQERSGSDVKSRASTPPEVREVTIVEPEVDPLDLPIVGVDYLTTALLQAAQERDKCQYSSMHLISRMLNRDITVQRAMQGSAAITIQCMLRLRRARMLRQLKFRRKSTVVLQEEQEDATLTIQGLVRCWQARRRLKQMKEDFYQTRQPAGVMVQTFCRSYSSALLCSSKINDKRKKAIVKIQCLARSHCARQEYKKRHRTHDEQIEAENKIAEAMIVQNSVRIWLAKRKTERKRKERVGDVGLLESIRSNMGALLTQSEDGSHHALSASGGTRPASTYDNPFNSTLSSMTSHPLPPSVDVKPDQRLMYIKWTDGTLYERELATHIQQLEARKRTAIERQEIDDLRGMIVYHNNGMFSLEGDEKIGRNKYEREQQAVRDVLKDLERKERGATLDDINTRYLHIERLKSAAEVLQNEETEKRKYLVDLFKIHTKKFGVQFMWGALKMGVSRLESAETANRKHSTEAEQHERERLQTFIQNQLEMAKWEMVQGPSWVTERNRVTKEERYQRVLIEEEADDLRWALKNKEKQDMNDLVGKLHSIFPSPFNAWQTHDNHNHDPTTIGALLTEEERGRDHLVWTWFWGHQRLTEWHEREVDSILHSKHHHKRKEAPGDGRSHSPSSASLAIGLGGQSAMVGLSHAPPPLLATTSPSHHATSPTYSQPPQQQQQQHHHHQQQQQYQHHPHHDNHSVNMNGAHPTFMGAAAAVPTYDHYQDAAETSQQQWGHNGFYNGQQHQQQYHYQPQHHHQQQQHYEPQHQHYQQEQYHQQHHQHHQQQQHHQQHHHQQQLQQQQQAQSNAKKSLMRSKIESARSIDSSFSGSPAAAAKGGGVAAPRQEETVAVLPDEEAWKRKQVASEEQAERWRLWDAKMQDSPSVAIN